MDAVLFSLLLCAGFIAMWFQRRNRWHKQLGPGPVWDEDVEIAMHLASHEAESRGQRVGAMHVIYALVQGEAIATAITAAGGDVEAVEDKVLAALDAGERDPELRGPCSELTADATQAVTWAAYSAWAGERQVAVTDVWAGLIQSGSDAVAVVEAGGIRAVDALFVLVHGASNPEPPDAAELAVMLINDPMTTQNLVVEILCDEFELSRDDATARMLEAHTTGSGIVGRFPRSAACARVEAATERARALGYPLWLRLDA